MWGTARRGCSHLCHNVRYAKNARAFAFERRPLGDDREGRRSGSSRRKGVPWRESTSPPTRRARCAIIYDLGDKLLLVATDRISAFDYILEDEIPYKGQVLTQLSKFWFELLADVVENHLISHRCGRPAR